MVWSQLETILSLKRSFLDPHIAYACVGVFSTIFSLLSLFVKERLYIGEATVASIAGLIFGPHCLNWFDPLSWGHSETITLEISRIVLCVQIVAVAVELPKKYMKKHWLSVAIFLLPVMTAGWLVVGLFVWILIPHFTFSESLLVSACVTATDPVLAAAVVGKGKFAERVPGHLRNLLSAESGCNDGMAFPFIFLALNLLIHPGNPGEILKDWVLITILYQCVFGIILGVAIGYTLRKLVNFAEKKNTIDRESFLAFFIFLAFNSAGLGSLLGVDDLLVSFAAGSAFGWNGDFARKTEESHVSTVIDLIINLAFFVYFGAIVPWQEFNDHHLGLDIWRLVVLAFVVIFLRRLPAVVAMKPFTPDIKSWREAFFCGHFGPIGVGAIFAVILARRDLEEHFTHHSTTLDTELDFDQPFHQLLNTLWPITNFIVITSIVVHGSSVAVLTLGKRLNRMAITMTFTNTTANESSSNWLSRLQKLERTSTSFSLHRMDSSTTLNSSGNIDDEAALKRNETVETSGIKYRPAGGATRKKPKKKSKKKTSKLMKTLSRNVTTDGAEQDQNAELRQRPQSQFLQLGRPSTIANENDKDESDAEVKTSTESSPFSQPVTHTHTENATAFQEGNKIVIEDSTGEVIEELPIKKQPRPNSPRSSQGPVDEMSIHSMRSLERQLTQFSSATEDLTSVRSSGQSQPIPQPPQKAHHNQNPVGSTLARTFTSGSRKAYYKKGDPSHKMVYAHQIDDILLIENEDGDIIRRYKVNKHQKATDNRVRSPSVVSKALSLVGIKKKEPRVVQPDLERNEATITPEFDSGSPELQNSKVEKRLEKHITDVLANSSKPKTTAVAIPAIAEPVSEVHDDEEEESSGSEDSEYGEDDDVEDSDEDESGSDEDLEETAVERSRRLAALGEVSATRNADDEEE